MSLSYRERWGHTGPVLNTQYYMPDKYTGYCVTLIPDGVLHIRKEANSVDEQALDVKRSQAFVNKQGVREEILNMSYKENERRGINRGTLWRKKRKTFRD